MLLQVVRRLEAATHTEVAKMGSDSLLRTLNAFRQAIFLCDVASRGWPVLHANDAMLEHLGTTLHLATSGDMSRACDMFIKQSL